MIKPLINKVRCKKCGAIAIDGGKDYQRFTGSLKDIDDSYSVFEQK